MPQVSISRIKEWHPFVGLLMTAVYRKWFEDDLRKKKENS